MKTLPDRSIDMVLCDPPYGTTKCPWDSPINLERMWEQYLRLIKNNGAIVIFSAQPFTSALIHSQIDLFKYNWIWIKEHPTGFLNANYRPLTVSEDICVFSKGNASSGGAQNSMPYYPQGITEVNVHKRNRPGKRGQHIHQAHHVGENNQLNSDKPYTQKFTGYPNNLLNFDRDKPQVHPTQKPVALMEYLIRTYTKEGETVLDNCMGSGTTGVACKNLGRKFIGIEKDDAYFKIASDRLRD